MLCIQTLSQRHSCVSVSQSVSMFEDEKTHDRSPRVFIIWQVDWVLVIPSCFVSHHCFYRVVVVYYIAAVFSVLGNFEELSIVNVTSHAKTFLVISVRMAEHTASERIRNGSTSRSKQIG